MMADSFGKDRKSRDQKLVDPLLSAERQKKKNPVNPEFHIQKSTLPEMKVK